MPRINYDVKVHTSFVIPAVVLLLVVIPEKIL